MKVHHSIYIINLKRNPERKLFMKRQLDASGLNYQFVDAIDKYDLGSSTYRSEIALSLNMDKDNLEYKYTQLVRKSSSNKECNSEGLGQLACLLSHIRTYNLILKNNDDVACVLEDDAILLPTFAEMLTTAPKLSWDILMLASHSRTIRKTLENTNGIYTRIMKSHNYIVLVKSHHKKAQNMHRRVIELLGFSHRLYPNQSQAIMQILDEFKSRYRAMVELYNPRKLLVWLLSPSNPEQIEFYKTLIMDTAYRLGGLPVKHKQAIGNHHCITEPAERHDAAIGYLLRRSAVEKWRQVAIDKNIVPADNIFWHLYTNNRVHLCSTSPPCILASHTYMKYSAHLR